MNVDAGAGITPNHLSCICDFVTSSFIFIFVEDTKQHGFILIISFSICFVFLDRSVVPLPHEHCGRQPTPAWAQVSACCALAMRVDHFVQRPSHLLAIKATAEARPGQSAVDGRVVWARAVCAQSARVCAVRGKCARLSTGVCYFCCSELARSVAS